VSARDFLHLGICFGKALLKEAVCASSVASEKMTDFLMAFAASLVSSARKDKARTKRLFSFPPLGISRSSYED
jgi:hypothetical protein